MGDIWLKITPIHDEHLPADLDGILLYGGYPELNGEALERNASMKEEIAQAVKQGMPCMAECGGFMYLHVQNDRPCRSKSIRMAGPDLLGSWTKSESRFL